MMAPLYGRLSMPPLAMEATRCSTSRGMPAASPAAANCSAIAASAIDSPPEADPVIPASDVTVIASLTNGSGTALSASFTTRKPGSAAITAPDRQGVVSGKSVSVRVDLGGRRIIKQQTRKHITLRHDNIKRTQTYVTH